MVTRRPGRARGVRRAAGTLVLDCSVALAWFFQDEADPYADGVARALGVWQAVVPAIWPLEVANTLVVGERRGRSTERQASVFLELLQALPITIDHAGAAAAWSKTLALARRFRLSAYDAAYLELAMRQGAELATRDRGLAKAAAAAGVSRFQLPKS